jgi:hypothetical protein
MDQLFKTYLEETPYQVAGFVRKGMAGITGIRKKSSIKTFCIDVTQALLTLSADFMNGTISDSYYKLNSLIHGISSLS